MNAYTLPMAPGLFSGFANAEKDNSANLTMYEKPVTKPAIDDVICHYLDGDTLKNALNFIDYVRASKMKIKWSAANVWSVRFKNKRVLDIIVREGSWKVRPIFEHISGSYMLSNQDQENIRAIIGALRNSSSVSLEHAPALS